MRTKAIRGVALLFFVSGLSLGSLYLWKIKKSVDGLLTLPEVYSARNEEAQKEGAASEGNTEGGSSEGHGGGHGEAKSEAKGHGQEHGEEAKGENGHGGKAHGATRSIASTSKAIPIFSVDEIFVNVTSVEGSHMMGLKLDLELFEEKQRTLVKSRHSGVRDRIIELSRDFDYEKLNSLGGKLYFKEKIVGALNEFFGEAIIKNAHISSLYLQ